jgi:hypothetical protein
MSTKLTIRCDACGREEDASETTEDFPTIKKFMFGHYSMFADDGEWTADLCEPCVKHVLSYLGSLNLRGTRRPAHEDEVLGRMDADVRQKQADRVLR